MSEFQALVESNRRLTEAVEFKINEIDKKVDQATASVPNTVRSMASAQFFVSNSGSDSAGDGTELKPFKTIIHAIKQAIPGSLVDIRVEDNQEYICESSNHHNSSNGKVILIRTYGSSGVKPTLRFRMTQGAFGSAYVCNYFEGASFSITFSGVSIVHESIPDGGRPYSSDTFGGVITRGTFGGGGIDVTARFTDTPIVTGDLPFITGQMGYINLHIYGGSMSKGGTSDKFMPGEGLPLARMIGLKNASISGFTSNLPEDLFGYDGTKVAAALGQGI